MQIKLATFYSLPLLLALYTANAGSSTWQLNPASGDWNATANWMPNTVPNGPTDTATFDVSNTTKLFFSAKTEVNGIVFDPDASAFTITVDDAFILTISGAGITNNSGIVESFVTTGGVTNLQLVFTNSATAGNQTVFTNNGGVGNGQFGGSTRFAKAASAGDATFITNGGASSIANGGFTEFFGNSTAANAIFITNAGAVGGAGSGFTQFFDDSTAANATFTANGGAADAGSGATQFFAKSTAGFGHFTAAGGVVNGGFGGVTQLLNKSTAASGIFIANGGIVSGAGGGETEFLDTADAADATLISNSGVDGADGGVLFFFGDSSGGTARVEVFGNGKLDVSSRNALGLSIGSIEGDGLVFLGARNLTVGSNDLNTVFAGVIQDGGFGGGIGGSITKVGLGRLVLTKANTYTGGTIINGGKVSVTNQTGSGTGSGAVQVNAGRLAGTGLIAGAVTIGAGNGPGAVLAPGRKAVSRRPLTIQNKLTFNSDASYNFELNSSNRQADKVVANGVSINSGSLFAFADRGDATLPLGTVFTAIDNTAATVIVGTFSNLPDSSTFTEGGNTFQADYEGGDGNDLTLTVVP